ncbi:phosphoethanolamine transferase [Aureibaculum sp. A20]|uniref:Phosphoethanolamine transferase n=1 Tax=Aureibaculum flavum TaxID=2795986 RepID=A0ABS0WM58_9FLAO|nr:phosphoethanolamine transferase [Aureibaculum flavum]MBJ2173036.1 phosphoethanolamine transferase [Aureibaculum flavum]
MNRKKQYFYLALLWLIVMLPNLLLIVIGEDSVIASFLKKIVFFILCSALTTFLLSFLKPKYFGWFTLIVFPFLVFELSMIYYYKAPSSEESISLLFLTNYHEATEIIKGNLQLLLFTIAFLFVILWLIIKLKKEFKLYKRQRIAIFLFSISIIGILYIRNVYAASKLHDNLSETLNSANYSLQVQLGKIFPLDVFIKLNSVSKGIKKRKEYKENVKDFKFGAIKNDTLKESEIYVLVIGETARKHNFSIYGYPRKTSPNLDTITNVIPFTNVNSAANLTSISIPFILTRATPNNMEAKFNEPAVVNAFKEAGFKTYWITNQSIGIGSVFGFYSSLADTYENTAVSLDAATYDAALFPILHTFLQDTKNTKKFIVIHTIGSHFRYNYRYPESYNIFKPSLTRDLSLENTTSISKKEELINSYDNSIFYTDFVLNNIIEQLKSTKSNSYLYYISDHGENLYDDEDNKLLHGFINPTKYEIEVPLIVWTSDEYNKNYPQKIKNLKRNQHLKISSTNSFHTLLDMANIYYPSEKLKFSFADSVFNKNQNRYLYKTNGEVLKLE